MRLGITKTSDGYELSINGALVKRSKTIAPVRRMANEIIFNNNTEVISIESNLKQKYTKYKGYRICSSPLYVSIFNGHIELPDKFMSIFEAKAFINRRLKEYKNQ